MLAIGKRPAQSARPDVGGEATGWPAPRPRLRLVRYQLTDQHRVQDEDVIGFDLTGS